MYIPTFYIRQIRYSLSFFNAIFLSVFFLFNFTFYSSIDADALQPNSNNTNVISSISVSSTISSTNTNSAETKIINTTQFSGDISRKEGNKIYVTKDTTTKEYSLSPNVLVKKDTFSSSFDKLQVGDFVTLKEDSRSANVLSIEAVSKQVFDYSKFLVPGLILLIILAILAYYIFKKSNTKHIQTNKVTRI